MLEICRSVDPALYKEMMHQSDECDRLGISGANLFRCSGYVAPIHHDKDATRGLCSQLRWQAKREYDEYSFCQPQFGYYIRTEGNMVW